VRETIIENLADRIRSYSDLVATIDAEDLVAKLDVPKDKSVAEHLWCIVGSRESYAKAMIAGQWQGFSCSMSKYDREDFDKAVSSSGQALLAAVRSVSDWSAERDQLLAAVSEHEVMHEGQIIRHMYGLGRDVPPSWRWA
jgi:uncharacterized damage-inducible protein DinB